MDPKIIKTKRNGRDWAVLLRGYSKNNIGNRIIKQLPIHITPPGPTRKFLNASFRIPSHITTSYACPWRFPKGPVHH